MLLQHLTPITGFSGAATFEEEPASEQSPYGEAYARPIEDLDLSMRAYNCLKRAGITKVGEVLERLERGTAEMLAIRNFGEKSLMELLERMREKGFLPEDYDPEA